MSESGVGPNVPAMEEATEDLPDEQATSHEADIDAGYDDDDDGAVESAQDSVSDREQRSSHADDIRAGYDDESDSPVGEASPDAGR